LRSSLTGFLGYCSSCSLCYGRIELTFRTRRKNKQKKKIIRTNGKRKEESRKKTYQNQNVNVKRQINFHWISYRRNNTRVPTCFCCFRNAFTRFSPRRRTNYSFAGRSRTDIAFDLFDDRTARGRDRRTNEVWTRSQQNRVHAAHTDCVTEP
jgi:hypothetical protein